jgi:hypothetical protein
VESLKQLQLKVNKTNKTIDYGDSKTKLEKKNEKKKRKRRRKRK